MGNALQVSLRNYSGSLQFPSSLHLGGSAAIQLVACSVGADYRLVQYKVDGSICTFGLVLERDECVKVKEVKIVVANLGNVEFGFFLRRTQTGSIQPESDETLKWMKTNRTVGARGGITDTKVCLYGEGNMAGVFVLESKKNIWNDGEISEVTLAHYFAHGSGSAFMRTESDIGLSIVANVRASNGNLDVTVEGLEEHPVSALFYMFHEVNRTGVWKRTMCPHCADKRRGRMFWQSEGEGSDSSSTPQLHGSRINASMIDNDGLFMGNGNGGFIQHAHFNVFQ